MNESQRIAQLGHYIYDIEGDRWRGSPSLYEVLGVDESYARDLVGWLDLVHPEDRERLSRYIAEDVLGRRAPSDIQYRIVRPRDKTERWVHDLGTLEVSADGQVVSIFGIIQDITDSKQAEKTLETSERRFRDIADHAQEWFWEVDAEGRYTYSSPVVERILGYTAEEVLQKRFYDLFLPDDREALKAAALASFATKQPFRGFVNCNVHKNGSIVWLSTSGLPLLDDRGNLLGYRGVDTDVTERRQAEKELEDQLAELQRWYDVMLGRESRVLDLKSEVNELLREAGHTPRYPSAEAEE